MLSRMDRCRWVTNVPMTNRKLLNIATGLIPAQYNGRKYVGIDPGKSGAIAGMWPTHNKGNFYTHIAALGKNVEAWPWIVAQEIEETYCPVVVVESPHLSMGKPSFHAGILYGTAIYTAGGCHGVCHLMHPATIKKIVGQMLDNLEEACVDIAGADLSPSDYGNKLDRIRLALTLTSNNDVFFKRTGKVNDNYTDAYCHMLAGIVQPEDKDVDD